MEGLGELAFERELGGGWHCRIGHEESTYWLWFKEESGRVALRGVRKMVLIRMKACGEREGDLNQRLGGREGQVGRLDSRLTFGVLGSSRGAGKRLGVRQ